MSVRRARYVTVCQQLLATAVVCTVGLSAASVLTLDIVHPGSAGDTRPSARDTGSEQLVTSDGLWLPPGKASSGSAGWVWVVAGFAGHRSVD